MSCLAIYRPDEAEAVAEPNIIKFPGLRLYRGSAAENRLLERARLLRLNTGCPDCGSVAVDPIELNDGILNAHSLPIYGTATIVAFHCNRCYHEWSAR